MRTKSFQDITSFGTATIGERGQVVIPAGIRKRLRLKNGERFIVFFAHSEAVIFVPANRFGKMISEFDKKLAKFKHLTK